MAKNVRPGRAPRLQVQTADTDPRIGAVVDRLDFRKYDVLDKSQPHGVVSGNMTVTDVEGAERRVAYEVKARKGSGGRSKLYDHQGQRIYRDESELPRKAPAQAAPPPQAALQPPEDEEDEEDEAAEVPMRLPPNINFADGIEIVPQDVDGVNFVAWIKGQPYRWAQLREAAAERFSVEVKDEDNLIDLLLTEKVITLDDVKARRGG